jgi:hypothetical protein
MTKVWVIQGEHDTIPGRPMIVCGTKDAADREAAALVSIICRDHDIPGPDHPSHWAEVLSGVQDRIIADNEIELDDIDDTEERGDATGCDVWIDEKELVE